jgi:transcription elongation factor Elf1
LDTQRTTFPWLAVVFIGVLIACVVGYVLVNHYQEREKEAAAKSQFENAVRTELSAEKRLLEADLKRLDRWRLASQQDKLHLLDDCKSCKGRGILRVTLPEELGAKVINCPVCEGDGISAEAKQRDWELRNPEKVAELQAKLDEIRKSTKRELQDALLKAAGYCLTCNGRGIQATPDQKTGGIECRACGGRGRLTD